MNGWILLHKKIWDNQLFNGNPFALAVWVWLLTHCDADGNVKCGRNQIASDTGVKGETVRYWLTRFLQENHQLTTNKTTNKFSSFHICNWEEYQRKTTNTSTRKLPTTYQPPTTNKEERIKNKNIDTKVSSRVSDETSTAITRLYELYLQEFDTTEPRFKLTPGRRAKLGLRVKDAGEPLVAQAIRNTAASPFHRGENDRGWKANLDFILRTYEQVEKLAEMEVQSNTDRDAEELRAKWMNNRSE